MDEKALKRRLIRARGVDKNIIVLYSLERKVNIAILVPLCSMTNMRPIAYCDITY